MAGRDSSSCPVAVAVQGPQNPGRQGQLSLPCCCCSSGSTESWQAVEVLPSTWLVQLRFSRIMEGRDSSSCPVAVAVQVQLNPGRQGPPSPVAVAVQVPQNPDRLWKASPPRGWFSSVSAESWQAGTVLPPLLLLQFRFHRILAGCGRPPLHVAGAVQAQQNHGRQGQFSLPCCCCSSGSTESWQAVEKASPPPVSYTHLRAHETDS